MKKIYKIINVDSLTTAIVTFKFLICIYNHKFQQFPKLVLYAPKYARDIFGQFSTLKNRDLGSTTWFFNIFGKQNYFPRSKFISTMICVNRLIENNL